MTTTVLLISLYFLPEIGGGATGAWNRATLLAKIGYKVYVLCGFPSYPTGEVKDKKYKGKFFVHEKMGGFEVLRIRLPALSHEGYLKTSALFISFVLLALIYLPRIYHILPRQMSLTYARSPVLFSSFIGLIYSTLLRTRYIYEVPDIWPEELLVFKNPLLPIIMALGKLLARLSYYFPDLIVTISDSAANYIRENYRPSHFVLGIPVGVEPQNFPRVPKEKAREELVRKGIYGQHLRNKFIILYSGRVSTTQGVTKLCDAAKKLSDFKQISILIVGEGNNLEDIKFATTKLNLQNIQVLPFVGRDLMPLIISSSDICVVMLSGESIFKIAMPTKFFEYLACCKPILAVSDGELAATVKKNALGETAPAGKIDQITTSILSLYKDPARLKACEENCESLLSHYSLDTISVTLKNVIASLDEVESSESSKLLSYKKYEAGHSL